MFIEMVVCSFLSVFTSLVVVYRLSLRLKPWGFYGALSPRATMAEQPAFICLSQFC